MDRCVFVFVNLFHARDTPSFHNFNFRIFNLRIPNPNKLIVNVFFDTMSDFNVPKFRPKKIRLNFGNRPYPGKGRHSQQMPTQSSRICRTNNPNIPLGEGGAEPGQNRACPGLARLGGSSRGRAELCRLCIQGPALCFDFQTA